MPHVNVKMYAGRTDQQKADLAAAIVDDVVRGAGCDRAVVSVAIEEFAPEDWPSGLPSRSHGTQGTPCDRAKLQPF